MTVNDTSAERIVLPSYIVPERYDLSLTPDLQAFTFKGKAVIDFEINADELVKNNDGQYQIVLHAQELLFESALYTLDGNQDDTVTAEQIHVNFKETVVTFIFPTAIPTTAKTLQLTVVYQGFLNNQMAGFYRSSYTNMNGETCIMASTQFEALDARRAFPCVDEPARKAVFVVTLTIASALQCCSNMPEHSSVSLDAKTKQVSFWPTPRMSTYLLAFCVGEFDFVQAQTSSGVLIKVYTPVGKSKQGEFALDCACKCLELYNDFFQVPYPLPKLDMIAIPEFAAGAMENWGLVTYREVDLLIDPTLASSQQKQRVAVVVNHELAHQWFGNLVTMDWWSGLWLNESFASWCENYATNALYPEYHMWDQFVTGHLAAALRLDALQSSHPIDVPIRHAEEVNQVFDAISYCKGAAVVRMIQAVLGFAAFQEGLQHYMKEYAYKNTCSMDLWQAWEKVSGLPVGELMGSWTHQMGFPLLKVVKEEWKTDSVTLELEQSWFLSDGTVPEEKKLWTIPIMTCTADGSQPDMTLMREATATVTIPLSSPLGWVKLNAGQQVPMRISWTSEMLKRYQEPIQSGTMNAMDRAGLVTDAYALVKAGHMKPEQLIQLLQYYLKETEYVVWEGLSMVLGGIESIVSEDPELSKHFHQFGKRMVLNLLPHVGWQAQPGEAHLMTLLRGLLIGLLSEFAFDDAEVALEAKSRFESFLENPNNVQRLPSDIRAQVFKIVLQNGGATEYQHIKGYYKTATDNAERKHVLNSLGSIPDEALKIQTMEWMTSGEIKIQDFFSGMGSVGRSNRLGRQVAWKYFQDNLEKIKGMVSSASSSLMDACIVMCCGGFCSDGKVQEIEQFFQRHPLPKSSRKIEQTLENMRANANFLKVLQASDLSKESFWLAL